MTETVESAVTEAVESPEVAYELLANSRRRRLLSYLVDTRSPVAVADVVRELATQEHDRSFEEIPEDELRRIHVSLYHVHIPKLADEGAVTYDEVRGTVALCTS